VNKFIGASIAILMLLLLGCDSSDIIEEPDNSSSIDNQLLNDPNSITSLFNTDDEGWQIAGDAQNGSVTPTYVAQTKDESAHISADDTVGVGTGTWYFSAPAKFKGDIVEFYAGTLSFELKTSSTRSLFTERDIILKSGDVEISTQLSRIPESEFTTFTISLTEAGWVDSSEKPIDVNIFTSVLMNVESLQIRGEFNVGADIGGLDNVVLSRQR